MTINDQIRDAKLEYDLNREVAKILALSSGKIHKYKHLNGEDVLPSNQQQIIEQAKFTYSPLGKAFEKQIKTIENQGEKQIDALKNLENQNKQLVNVDYDYGDKLLYLKKREIFLKMYKKRLDKIEQRTKKYEKEIKFKSKKKHQQIFIFFLMEEMKLFNFMMIILQ